MVWESFIVVVVGCVWMFMSEIWSFIVLVDFWREFEGFQGVLGVDFWILGWSWLVLVWVFLFYCQVCFRVLFFGFVYFLFFLDFRFVFLLGDWVSWWCLVKLRQRNFYCWFFYFSSVFQSLRLVRVWVYFGLLCFCFF